MENNFCGFIHNMLEITTGILGFVHHQGLRHLFTGQPVADILQANSIINLLLRDVVSILSRVLKMKILKL